MKPYFSHRSCYVNLAEHLQNSWNANVLFPGAPNRWSGGDWKNYSRMLKAFGFNILEFWLPPTMFSREALAGEKVQTDFIREINKAIGEAHKAGLMVKVLMIVNTIGQKWFFACPRVPEEKQLILKLWDFWSKALETPDIFCIFPGDPGGCARHGCTHEDFIRLALEISGVIKRNSPSSRVSVGTWGAPFSGWGSDYFPISDDADNWEKMEKEFIASGYEVPIWNGRMDRAKKAASYLVSQLDDFPEDTMIEINLGFSSDATYVHGGPAKKWAREIARKRDIVTWDYSLSEGELITYPHWRLPRMSQKIREWRSAAPYKGGMSYTMTPKLNLLSQYAAAKLMSDPDLDPDRISADFCASVFGEEHRELGELFEAFEVVDTGWGYYPRHRWSREALREAYGLIIEHLEAADVSGCSLPLFPSPEEYRQDLLWFARIFLELAADSPDRESIRKRYWEKSMKIYDHIPMSEDKRAERSAELFSQILAGLPY
ncbi:MAG: hypothetical protein ILO36_01845 [Abditibacteriota bacterium]|nr:hypothetical protein [Abditibacteriota bacterium]